MTAPRALATLLVVLLVAGAWATTSAEARTPCRQRGDRTIARNGEARVFSMDGSVYACTYRRNRVFLIFDGAYEDPGLTRLAGHLVAQDYPYSRNGLGTYSSGGYVGVRSLRTGKVRSTLIEGGGFAAFDLVLKSNGSFADIRRVIRDPTMINPAGGTPFEVRRFDSRGSQVLARGLDIQYNSLSLRNSYIRWKQGGRTFGATLR